MQLISDRLLLKILFDPPDIFAACKKRTHFAY